MAKRCDLNDGGEVDRVEFPEKGGTFTYFKGHKLPFPGFPHERIVEKVALIKSFIPAWLKTIKLVPKTKILKIIDIGRMLLKGVVHFLANDKINPERYSHPVREIYRIFNILIEREKEERLIALWTQLRDVLCMILEFDNAYRFRIQDALAELNLDEIKPDKSDTYYIRMRDDYKYKVKDENRKKET